MGAEFDSIARAIASDMPRRKLLKMLAGGLAASAASVIAGRGMRAAAGSELTNPALINGSIPPIFINETIPPIFVNGSFPPFFINETFPTWKHGFTER